MKKRVISLFMALVMCLSLVPTAVWAQAAEGVDNNAEQAGMYENKDGNDAQDGQEPGEGGENSLDSEEKSDEPSVGVVSPQSAANGAAVQANDAVAEVTIDGTTTPYTDIDAAFAAAQEADSATVTLLADVTISHTDDTYGIKLEKGDITLELNGMTISQRSGIAKNKFYPASAVFYLSVPGGSTAEEVMASLKANVRLTVQDSVGGGKIVQSNGGPAIVATNNGTLTVNSGVIENTSSDDFDDGRFHRTPNCAVLLSGSGKAVINGGTLSGMRGVAVTGYITKGVTELIKQAYGVEYSNELYGNELTVTGGEISGTSGNALIVYEKAKKIELSGGTFTTQSNEHSIWVADTEPDKEEPIKGDAASLLKDGCRYENNGAECAYSAEGNGVVGNATVALRPANEIAYIGADGKLTARADCTEITAETDDISHGWYVLKEDVTVSLLNISEEVNVILCDGATLTVSSYFNVGQDSTLNLYWQSAGTGKLTAKAIGMMGTVTAPAGGMKQTTGASGTTFEKCFEHDREYKNNGDTHTATCKLCGKVEAAESHKYESWASTDADTHTGMCACGATSTENHTLTLAPNDDGLTHSTKCSVCDYATAAEDHDFSSTDEFGNQKCACGARLAAEYDGKNYATLESAIEAARDGGTVKLAATVTENITIADGTVIIDLNGEEWYNDDRNAAIPTLTVTGGDVTVQNGTLKSGSSSKAATAVVVEGGKLTVGEGMTIQGGSMDKDKQFPAIEVAKSGELSLCAGAELGFGMKVSAEGKQLKDYLPEGTAFTVNGTAINGYVTEYSSRETLVVAEHTHSYDEDGKCACGFVCTHTGTIGEDGKCTVCGAQMAAKDDSGKYYTDLEAALKQVADNGKVTMLTDDQLAFPLFVLDNENKKWSGKSVKLVMDGKKLFRDTNTPALVVASGKLTIEDKATISHSCEDESPEAAVSVLGGTLELKQPATITGGLKVWSFTDGNDEKHIGTLEGGLPVGTIITKTGVTDNYFSVSVEGSENYTQVRELLPVGCAFAKATVTTAPNEDVNTETTTVGDILPANVSALTEDVIVVECTHKNGDANLLENGICVGCGYVCPHTSIDNDSKKCNTCEAQMVAQVGDSYYSTLATAIEAAKDNGTVTLLDLGIWWALKESVTVGSGTKVTINMNAVSWEEGNATSPVLTVDGGDVTLNGGYLTINKASTASGVVVVKSGSLTLGEAMVIGNNFWAGPAIVVEGGDLTLGTDTKLYRGMKTSVEGAKLADYLPEGTAFKKSDNNNFEIIIDGYVTDLTGSSQFHLDVAEHTHDMKPVMNKDEGILTGYLCDCGFTCEHKYNFVNGICQDCGLPCKHGRAMEQDDEIVCSFCKKPFAVQVMYNNAGSVYGYYGDLYMQTFEYDSHGNSIDSTLRTILNGADGKSNGYAPDGSTVTLLTDDLNANAVVNNSRSITLDLNGKKLIETDGIRVEAGSKLTVTGEGSSSEDDNSRWPCVFNVQGGTLVFKEMEFGGTFNSIRVGSGTLTSPGELEDAIKIGTLEIDDANAKVSFKAAAFDKIVFSRDSGSVKLGDLLGVWKDAEGNTVRSGNAFQNADGKLLRYNTVITKDTPIENVKTAACTHDSVTGRTCDYCGTENLVATVIDGGGSIATYAATDDSAETAKVFVGYALRGWNNTGNNRTLKLFVDAVLTKDETLNAAKHPSTGAKLKAVRVIDLNGHTFTGGDGNAYGVEVNELVTLTVKDSSAVKGDFSANVTVNDGGTLIVDGVKMGSVILNEGCTFTDKGGSYGSITAENGKLIDFLPEGYAFVGTDGKVKNAGTGTLENVTVAPHTDHSYEWNTVTHEHICGCGYVDKTDFDAPIFTDVENNGTYYNNKLTFTVNDAISGIKVVKDGDTLLNADKDGKYTIAADNREHTITATDNAGNTATVKITVYKVYKVTLPSGTGYTVSGPNIVNHGDEYVFTVRLEDGYSRVPGRYKVTASGFELTSMSGDNDHDQYWRSNVTGDLTITVEGIADITAPDAEIKIGENSFKQFLNTFTFGLFFKKTQTVTVTATDLGSGVDKVEYLLSVGALDKDDLPTDGWKNISLNNGKGSFSIEPNAKGSVYVRVTDKDGNVTVINSDGVVVYTDSTADTERISFTRLSDKDVSFEVNYNGNWFGQMFISDGETTELMIPALINSDGTITLKNEELRKLAVGEYTVTVVYRPMGENYVEAEGNEAPASTTVKLTVERATRTSLVFSAPDAVYDGAAYDGLTITGQPAGTTIRYKAEDAADDTYTAAVPKNAGSYTVQITTPQDENYAAATFTEDFSISRKEVTITGVTVSNKVYDGSDKATITKVEFNGLVGNETLALGTDYEIVSATFPDADADDDLVNVTITVKLKNTELAANYELKNGSYTAVGAAKIGKADSSVAAAPVAKTLTYTGEDQALVTAGAAIGGTMQYSVDGTPWQDTVPTGKNAGQYAVHYRVVGDKNHRGTETASLPVTIARQKVGIPAADETAFTYNGEEQTYTIAESALYTVEGNVRVDAGHQTVTAELKDKANYVWADNTDAAKTYDFTIEQKALTITAKDKTAHVGDKAPDLSQPVLDKDYTVEGLVEGDTLDDVKLMLGGVTLQYVDDKGKEIEPDMSQAGEVTIQVTAPVPEVGNYAPTCVDGKLTISKRSSYYYAPGSDAREQSPGTGDAGMLVYGLTALGGYTGTALVLRRRKRED